MASTTAAMPRVVELTRELVARSPAFEKAMMRRFKDVPPEQQEILENIAIRIAAIAGADLNVFLDDYVWLCQQFLEEEENFRRLGRYRYSTFKQAFDNVYSDDVYMTRYMNGLLMSQLWWSNHSEIIAFYRSRYLANLPASTRHLEIGPGHGLLLAYACEHSNVAHAEGWDISPASIANTEHTLRQMRLKRMPKLSCVGLLDSPAGQFDSIVFAEVLEHLEEPEKAMTALVNKLAPSGRLFIHMPINSPAPDHIFNLPTPEAVVEFVAGFGLRTIESHFAPITNSSLERARRLNLTISCGLIVQKSP